MNWQKESRWIKYFGKKQCDLAVLHNANPEKASIAVFASTLIAIVYIPFMLVLTRMLPFAIRLDFRLFYIANRQSCFFITLV